MSGRLPSKFTVPFHDDETTWSFISRVAFLNNRSPDDFCRDIGAPMRELAVGDQGAIDRLAFVTGACPSAIRARTFILTERNRYLFGEEVVGVQGLDFKTLRFCPSCISADIESGVGATATRPYRRASWVFGSNRTCPRHKVELVCTPASDGISALDFAVAIQPYLSEVADLGVTVMSDETVLEEYLTDRLAGKQGQSNWLDNIRIDVAGRICEIIGGTNVAKDVMTAHMTPDMIRQSVSFGFKAASDGETGIGALLARVQASVPIPPNTAPQAWPALCRYLAKGSDDPELDVIRDIIFDLSVRSMPLGPGDTCLGRPVQARVIHSVRSAAREMDMHTTRLRRLLEKGGIIPVGSSGVHNDRIFFDANAARPFLDEVKSALPLQAASRYINVSYETGRQLLAEGLLEPLVAPDVGELTQHAVPTTRLDALLALMTVNATQLLQEEEHFLSIFDVSDKMKLRYVDVMKMLIDGHLLDVRTDRSHAGVEAILVNPDEVRKVVRLQRPGLSQTDAANMLRISARSVLLLAKNGMIEPLWDENPREGRKNTIFDHASVADFAERYVSLVDLSKETGIHHTPLRRRLDDKGIAPAFSKDAVYATFYERCVLPNLS